GHGAVHSTGVRGAEEAAAIAEGGTVILRRRARGLANRVEVPTSGVTLVVILRCLTEEGQVQAFLPEEQSVGRDVGNIGDAPRGELLYHTRHVLVAGGVITQSVGDVAPRKGRHVVVHVGHSLRAPS